MGKGQPSRRAQDVDDGLYAMEIACVLILAALAALFLLGFCGSRINHDRPYPTPTVTPTERSTT